MQVLFPILAEALTLSLPEHAPEHGTVLSGRGKVTIPQPLASDLAVPLTSSDPSRATVPETVVIRAGETCASFDITIVDPGEVDGPGKVDIAASAEDGSSAEQTLTVLDNDPGQIRFSSEAYWVGEREERAVITVVRSSSSSEIRVDYETVNGTALAGADYESVSGTLTFHHGEVTKTFSVPLLDDSAAEEEKSVKIRLSHPTGGAVLGTPSLATLTLKDDDSPDFFTESFDQQDNDLGNQILTFVPDGSRSFYAACRTPAYSFPVDPSGGKTLALGDDASIPVPLAGGKEISFYGVRYRTFFISSNGYVTFSSGDGSYQESLSSHFTQPRLSALFDDLNPSHGGTVSWKQLKDRAVVTYRDVPKNYSGKRNSFQMEMFFDGVLRITHLGIATGDGLVGLSRGGGLPAEFTESDLSSYPSCFFLSVPESVTEGKDTDVLAPATLGTLIPPLANLEIRMSSSDPTELGVEKTVLFPQGESSVLFDLTTVDDHLLDGTQTVTLTATFPDGDVISAPVRVHDNEAAALTLELPEIAVEGEGRRSNEGVVRVSAAVDKEVTVFLSSDDPSEATVPETAIIPKGKSAALFDLTVEDDGLVDGPQTVTIEGSVPGWDSAAQGIRVEDNEALDLFLGIEEENPQGEAASKEKGTVSILAPLPFDLVIDLVAEDPSQVAVPPFVMIPAGETVVLFDLFLSESREGDSASVTLRASAPGWSPGEVTIRFKKSDKGPP